MTGAFVIHGVYTYEENEYMSLLLMTWVLLASSDSHSRRIPDAVNASNLSLRTWLLFQWPPLPTFVLRVE